MADNTTLRQGILGRLTILFVSDRMLVMLAIRLQRVGRKNDPSFRVIVTDSKLKPKTGNFLEILGSYDARKGKPVINTARAKHWLSMGAQASGTVHNLLVDLKAVTAKKINVLGKKTPIVKEAPVVEAPKTAPEVTAVGEAPVEVVLEKAPEAVTETPIEAPSEMPVTPKETPVTEEATPEVVA